MGQSDHLTRITDGLTCPDGGRWHHDELWFSDFFSRQIMRVGADGEAHVVAEVAGRPSGLGWLPDGRLLAVSMTDLKLLRRDPAGWTQVADLSPHAAFHTNDMVVDGRGRAYIGNCGFDYTAGAEPEPANLIVVEPDGSSRVAAPDLLFPNGMVITPDQRTLIVAETYGSRLTALTIAKDGSLGERRVWAALDGKTPDGICLDAEGALWVASPMTHEVIRVHEGGEISRRIACEQQPTCCVLGGPDGDTLFIFSTWLTEPPESLLAKRCGRIEAIAVEVAAVDRSTGSNVRGATTDGTADQGKEERA